MRVRAFSSGSSISFFLPLKSWLEEGGLLSTLSCPLIEEHWMSWSLLSCATVNYQSFNRSSNIWRYSLDTRQDFLCDALNWFMRESIQIARFQLVWNCIGLQSRSQLLRDHPIYSNRFFWLNYLMNFRPYLFGLIWRTSAYLREGCSFRSVCKSYYNALPCSWPHWGNWKVSGAYLFNSSSSTNTIHRTFNCLCCDNPEIS